MSNEVPRLIAIEPPTLKLCVEIVLKELEDGRDLEPHYRQFLIRLLQRVVQDGPMRALSGKRRGRKHANTGLRQALHFLLQADYLGVDRKCAGGNTAKAFRTTTAVIADAVSEYKDGAGMILDGFTKEMEADLKVVALEAALKDLVDDQIVRVPFEQYLKGNPQPVVVRVALEEAFGLRNISR